MDERFKQIVREVFNLTGDNNLSEQWTSDNIPGWDSLGHLNLMVAMEKSYAIKFEIEEMFQIRTLGDLARLIKTKIIN